MDYDESGTSAGTALRLLVATLLLLATTTAAIVCSGVVGRMESPGDKSTGQPTNR